MTQTQSAEFRRFLDAILPIDALPLKTSIIGTVDLQEAFSINNSADLDPLDNTYSMIGPALDESRYTDYSARKAAIQSFRFRSQALQALETSLNMIFQARGMMFGATNMATVSGIAMEIGVGVIKEFFLSPDAEDPIYLNYIGDIINQVDTPLYNTEGIVMVGQTKKKLSVLNNILRLAGASIGSLPNYTIHEFAYDSILLKYETGSQVYIDSWVKMLKVLEDKIRDFKILVAGVTLPIDPADQTLLTEKYFEIFKIFVTFLLICFYFKA